jgi:hypothetical protein
LKDGVAHPQCRSWTAFPKVITDISEVAAARGVSRTSSLEAAKGSFDFCVGRELTASRLGQSFQHRRKVSGINFFGLAVGDGQAQHRERDLVLAVRGNRRTASRAFSSNLVMASK